jgi:2-oxoglutarate dehydrogenase E2 component (dihydrolipoamide succinyltransferase)
MAVDVVMPQMGESIFEGTITKWLKKPGDKIERDEPLFEISTDKVDAEIPSPSAGVLKEIKVNEGQTVPIQTVVALIDAAGAPSQPAAPAPAKPAPATSAPVSAESAPAAKPAALKPVPALRNLLDKMAGTRFGARRLFGASPVKIRLTLRRYPERAQAAASASATF